MSQPQPPASPQRATADTILAQTNKVGRVASQTHGLVQTLAQALLPESPDDPGESPVLATLEQVLQALTYQTEMLRRIDARLAALETRRSR